MALIEQRMKAAVSVELLATFLEAASHLGTMDLVLFLEECDGGDHAASAAPRSIVVDDPMAPQFLRELVKTPAAEMEPRAAPGDMAFWLVYFAADGQSCCCAVNAKRIAAGQGDLH